MESIRYPDYEEENHEIQEGIYTTRATRYLQKGLNPEDCFIKIANNKVAEQTALYMLMVIRQLQKIVAFESHHLVGKLDKHFKENNIAAAQSPMESIPLSTSEKVDTLLAISGDPKSFSGKVDSTLVRKVKSKRMRQAALFVLKTIGMQNPPLREEQLASFGLDYLLDHEYLSYIEDMPRGLLLIQPTHKFFIPFNTISGGPPLPPRSRVLK